MSAQAAAAPRCRRRLGLATVLVLFGGLGFAASHALAGQALVPQVGTETTPTTSTSATTTAAPIPDPQPAPKPDPKPSRSRQRARVTPPPPPPPSPPPAVRRDARPSTPRTTATPAGPRPSLRTSRVTEAHALATQAGSRPRNRVVRKVRREPRPVRRDTPVVPDRDRDAVAAPAHQTIDLGPPPARVVPATESPPSGSLPLVLPLLGLGLLLVGASAVSARRVPWPELVGPLEAHRLDLAAAGIGAIALALLWLNFTVFL